MKRKVFRILSIVVTVLMIAFLVIELTGYRFNVNNVLYGDIRNAIECDEWIFEYLNVISYKNEAGETVSDFITSVFPIKKTAFLYKRVEDGDYAPAFRVYTAYKGDYVGILYRFEGKEKNYYFFCKGSVIDVNRFQEQFQKEGSYTEYNNKSFIDNWSCATSVKINGKEFDLFRHSYFTTAETFDSFHFGECELKLIPYEEDAVPAGTE